MSYLDIWQAMGLFAKSIVFVMVFFSLWSWTVAFTKWWYLRKSQSQTAKFAPQFSRALQEEQLDQAISLAEKNKNSHVARVLGEALTEVKPLLRDRATITAGDINSAERAVERQMLIITCRVQARTRHPGHGRRDHAVRRPARHHDGHRERRSKACRRRGASAVPGRDHRRHRRSADHHGVRSHGRDSGGVALQLLQHQDRLRHRRDDLHVQGIDRLPDQERRVASSAGRSSPRNSRPRKASESSGPYQQVAARATAVEPTSTSRR